MKVRWIIRGDSYPPPRVSFRNWWQRPSERDRNLDNARRYLTQQPDAAEVYNTRAEAEAAAARIVVNWALDGNRVLIQIKARRVP